MIRRMIAPQPPPPTLHLPLPSQAATKCCHASSATVASAQVATAVATTRCSGLRAGCGSSSKQNAIVDTCFLCCIGTHAECFYTWHRKGPSLQKSGRNVGFRRIPEQINLTLEWFNSDVCSAESEVIHGNRRIPKNEVGPEPEKKQNAQPIFSVLLQMSHPLGSHLLHSQTVLAQKLLLMGGAEGINQAEIICPPSPLSSSDVCCLPPLPHGSCTLCW